MRSPSITVTLRKRSTGHRLCAFLIEDLQHAYCIATALMQSPNYARAYCTASDWQGNELFTLQSQYGEQAVSAASVAYAPAARAPAAYPPPTLPAYAPQPAYGMPSAAPGYYPALPPAPHAEVDAEVVPDGTWGPPPPWPRR